MTNLFGTAYDCLMASDVADKLARSQTTVQAWQRGELVVESNGEPEQIEEVGIPSKPNLVPIREVPRRKLGTPEGLAALIHAIAHIEFNAINLAWDAVYRFRDMPKEYYGDWIKVAGEEAYHFSLLNEHLNTLGYQYGDFDAHDGLWVMARKTAHDPLVRMALVPRVMEARGLDVTPAMIKRLKNLGDQRAVEVLEIILRDEVGHVETGTRWFHYLCEQHDVDAYDKFRELIAVYVHEMNGHIGGPFHYDARKQAGFSREEMQYLESLC